jgi:cyclopropane-fatty-acyl-phospholipid synthase
MTATLQQAAVRAPADARTTRRHERHARAVLHRILAGLEHGRLTLADQDGDATFGHPSGACPLVATVRVHDPAFYPTVLFGGNVGAGRAYGEGLWSADDLVAAVRIMAANQAVLARVDGELSWLRRPIDRVTQWQHRNTRAGIRRNIAAHYDLGNDFFALFLDETLMYSCAWFETHEMTLADASRAKLDRICRHLELMPGDRVLEIGTGWGGFAEHAAAHYGVRVTTTTISPAQRAHASERIRRAGLAARVQVLGLDYRDLTGTYDRVVSIEMIEAVGAAQLPTFFRQASRLLRPDGLMALQAIVIPDRFYEHARRSVDFIKRYIFPGSFLPSVGALVRAIGTASDLDIVRLDDLTPHYAATLAHWRARFLAAGERIAALGFDPEFRRRWEYYFAYCEGGFRERVIGDVQMLLAKPLWRGRTARVAAPPECAT